MTFTFCSTRLELGVLIFEYENPGFEPKHEVRHTQHDAASDRCRENGHPRVDRCVRLHGSNHSADHESFRGNRDRGISMLTEQCRLHRTQPPVSSFESISRQRSLSAYNEMYGS